MIETKKKILIGIICIIAVVGGIIYYLMQKSEGEYFEFEEGILEENVEVSKNTVDIENAEMENKPQIIVHIAGQIANPGVISLNEGARIIDAINAAGGITQEADLSKVNLAYILEDAQRIYIPSINEKENESYAYGSEQTTIVTNGSSARETTTQTAIININTANEAELQKIPGIGQSIASRIVAYRKENGKFNTIEDIIKVSGIGTSKYNSIKNYICVK